MKDYSDNTIETRIDPSKPETIPKFVDSLPKPLIARPAEGKEDSSCREIFYNISMKEKKHKFHRYFPPTTIWGYNGMYPGPTIEVEKDVPVKVKWQNRLPDKHFLPIDRTLHGTMNTPDVRTVVHLHGANVSSHSDGHPDAWYTNNCGKVGYAFKRKVYEYTNHQPAATMWYHDHAVGITRLNVYAGLAGFYLIRDELEKRLNLPCGDYEIPLLIQDKTFNPDGSLHYPDNATPEVPAPIPSTPSFFFGNTIVVNGKLWPYLKVEPRKYRFRMLNGSNTRAYNLQLDNGAVFHQIGTDLGLLQHPVTIESFAFEPAERMDLIIDFSKYKGKEITLINTNPGASGSPHTDVIMKFIVGYECESKDRSEIPHELYPYHHLDAARATKERTMTLASKPDPHYEGRVLHLLNDSMWSDPCTEIVKKDSVEIWHIRNTFFVPHPIHVHLVNFEILGRKTVTDKDFDRDGNYIFKPETLEKPLPFETGLKDVVRTEPNQVTSIIMHFKEHVGDYVWHCHILEHEDNDMMRPLKVIE
ncbi:spore coat protein A [Alkalibaculum bacchi]|uniref:Spore coat protein A n=1 Tax=Alkalibaculum bacchi TaxID=645887 RepID=A0A366HXG5_9FIRM|nr:multicopper oxidase domain-containing protein [Alkalibaculum bacchi]RBP57964.1 spore coat protein A [Alkalibaculum bacchi]